MQFHNRKHAGQLLAEKMNQYSFEKNNTIVLALPSGGVAVAEEIAKKFHLPLDIILVKKIGAPSYPELSIGSISEEGEEFYNQELLKELGYKHSDLDPIKEQTFIKLQETGNSFRQGLAPLNLTYKNIIVVDDGIDSGATMEVVLQVLKNRNVKKITIAVPVISAEALLRLKENVDDIIVLLTPNPVYSIGEWYENFIPIGPDEVKKILAKYSLINKRRQQSL